MSSTTASVVKWLGIVASMVVGSALSAATVMGDAAVIASDIVHSNGNVYDQVLLRGAVATVQADPGQVARVSFLGLNDEIVQIEFAGKGALTISLANASGPMAAEKYNQPGVEYMRGHPSLLITGSDATTNLSVFSVGRITAVNQSLFRADVAYLGVAGVSLLEIEPDASASGGLASFGGIRMGNVDFFGTQGLVGIYAPNVRVHTVVTVGDVAAYDHATPVLVLGDMSTNVTVAGGGLIQANGSAVLVRGFDRLQMVVGTNSAGLSRALPITTGKIERDGQDVTNLIFVSPVLSTSAAATVAAAVVALQTALLPVGGGVTVAPVGSVSNISVTPTTPPPIAITPGG